jgi:hypothetical protein
MTTTLGYAVSNGFLGLALEAVRGTAAADPIYTPAKEPKYAAIITWLDDDSLRGSMVATYDSVQGVRHGEFDLKGNVQMDTFPILLQAALGGADAIAGDGPYGHTQGLLNDYTVGSQPLSLSLWDFTGAITNLITGAQLDSLELTWAIDAALTYTAKAMGDVATNPDVPTPSFSTEPLVPAWDTVTTINDVTVTTLVAFTCKIDRKAEVIHAGGSADPYDVFAGPVDVTGKITLVVDQIDDPLTIGGSEWNLATPGAGLVRLPLPVTIVFTDPNLGHSLELQMSAVQFKNPVIERGKKHLEVSADYTAIANTTDAIATGWSPIKTIATNAVATAYVGS